MCIDLFDCNHLDCLDEELPTRCSAWDDAEPKDPDVSTKDVLEVIVNVWPEGHQDLTKHKKEDYSGPSTYIEHQGVNNMDAASTKCLDVTNSGLYGDSQRCHC